MRRSINELVEIPTRLRVAAEVDGWEAGIRTPITCSRGMRPTVGRPPSTDRSASKGTELSIIAHRPVWEIVLSSANFFAAHHLFAATCIRRDFARLILLVLLFLLTPMACHPALAAGLARLFTRPLVRGAFLVRRFPALAGNLALLDPF